MGNEKKIKNFFNKKELTDAVYFEAHKDNALFNEREAFLEAVRDEKQYQDDYDYNVMQYRHMKLLEKYEGVERTSKELRMINQLKFMQAQLPIFAEGLSKMAYYEVVHAFDREGATEEQLNSLKNIFRNVLFLAAKSDLTDFQEKALISSLAKIDVDTTIEDLKEVKLYNVANEKKYVGVKKEVPKNDCPAYDVLAEQLPERLIESIATTTKQIFKRAMIKRKNSEFTFAFNNQEMLKLARDYSKKILNDYKKRPNRYIKECHSTMDVVNAYFDIKGRSRAKFKALTQELEKNSKIKELKSEDNEL
jgi:hypothetical protein